MAGPWKDFTTEDWEQAEYCKDCGLPLILTEENEMMCVYCTWMEDQTVIENGLRAEIDRLKKAAEQVESQGAFSMEPEGTVSEKTELLRVNGVTFINFSKHSTAINNMTDRLERYRWRSILKEKPPTNIYIETLMSTGEIQGNILYSDRQTWAFGGNVKFWREIIHPGDEEKFNEYKD